MSKNFTSVVLFVAIVAGGVLPAFAANKITASFGGTPNLCTGTAGLLTQFVKISTKLRELKAKGGSQEEIARHEAALEVVVDGLDPRQYGMTAIVQVDGPKTVQLQIPSLVVSDKRYLLASVRSENIQEGSTKLEISGDAAQVKIDFKLLGICSFANPVNGSLDSKEIQQAVDSILGR